MNKNFCCSAFSSAFGVVGVLDVGHPNRCVVRSQGYFCSFILLSANVLNGAASKRKKRRRYFNFSVTIFLSSIAAYKHYWLITLIFRRKTDFNIHSVMRKENTETKWAAGTGLEIYRLEI